MSFINNIIETLKGWGFTEWILTGTVIVELYLILFYNKGALMCKDKLESYENELKDANEQLEHYKKLFDERGEIE